MPTETSTRQYTTRRQNIVNALVDALELIDGTGAYQSSLHTVEPRLKFWDGVTKALAARRQQRPLLFLGDFNAYKVN